MCGIVYVKRLDNKPAAKQVLRRYKKQKSRGSEGFGFIGIKQSGRATPSQRFMYESQMVEALKDLKHHQILMHHRWPTSTPNVPESAHPLLISHTELQYDYYVVHNGTISNDDQLKPVHEGLGYVYRTELFTQYTTKAGNTYHDPAMWNDSEALAIELARTIEGKQDKVEAKGNIAYIVLQVEKVSRQSVALYYGTNSGNPLTVQRTKDFVCIASEGGTAINNDICYRLDLKTHEVTVVPTVKMQSANFGHKKYTSTVPYSGYFSGPYDDDRGWANDSAIPARKSEVSRTINQVEEELQGLEEEIIGASADIDLAIEQGDTETEREAKADLKELKERQRRLELRYETLTLSH